MTNCRCFYRIFSITAPCVIGKSCRSNTVDADDNSYSKFQDEVKESYVTILKEAKQLFGTSVLAYPTCVFAEKAMQVLTNRTTELDYRDLGQYGVLSWHSCKTMRILFSYADWLRSRASKRIRIEDYTDNCLTIKANEKQIVDFEKEKMYEYIVPEEEKHIEKVLDHGYNENMRVRFSIKWHGSEIITREPAFIVVKNWAKLALYLNDLEKNFPRKLLRLLWSDLLIYLYYQTVIEDLILSHNGIKTDEKPQDYSKISR